MLQRFHTGPGLRRVGIRGRWRKTARPPAPAWQLAGGPLSYDSENGIGRQPDAVFHRMLKTMALAALALFMMAPGVDNLDLDPAQLAALPHRYSIAKWEAANLLSKWMHMAARLSWMSDREREEDAAIVIEYFRLAREASGARARLSALAAEGRPDAAALEEELRELLERRGRLRNDVEEVMESAISSALLEVEVGSWGPIMLPPVDIRLADTPKLLVTSPRHRIERAYEVLLEAGVSLEESRRMEEELMEEWDLSALVVPVGGLSTYPASVAGAWSLEWTLRVAAHEWVHNYLSARFTPLGVNFRSSREMLSLNEMTADLVGDEIGDRAYEIMGFTREAPPDEAKRREVLPEHEHEPGFDFASEMRQTRKRVDELLAEGAVEEAEEYMERRRNVFVDNGHNIRKLNQAYFAFHGTYPSSPTSVSPIGPQVREFRSAMPDVGAFLVAMSRFGSYAEFLDALEAVRRDAAETEMEAGE